METEPSKPIDKISPGEVTSHRAVTKVNALWPQRRRSFKNMRIAQTVPLTESVPPRQYGGIERVVWFLTEQLVAMGHDVTLFASGDSVTRAKLVAGWPRALRFEPDARDNCQLPPFHRD